MIPISATPVKGRGLAPGQAGARQAAPGVHAVEEGLFYIAQLGRALALSRIFQNAFYDLVPYSTIAGATLGTRGNANRIFFSNVASKPRHHTNLMQDRKIPNSFGFNLLRVGIHVAQQFNNYRPLGKVSLAIYNETFFKFELDSGNVITEGPTFRYQSGYGQTGSMQVPPANALTDTAMTGADGALLTNGLPSGAMAPTYYAAQPITDRHDLIASLKYEAPAWFNTVTGTDITVASDPNLDQSLTSPAGTNNGAGAYCVMDGIVERPVH